MARTFRSPVGQRPRETKLALAALGLLFVTWATAAPPPSALQNAVRVAGEPVSPAELIQAVSICGRDPLVDDVAGCLDTHWVPRWLFDREAHERRLANEEGVSHRLADLLHVALVEDLADKQTEPTEEDVDHYIERHRRDFEKPLRIRLFRILVDSEEEARRLVTKLTGAVRLEDFRQLARKQSVDTATSERGGDLGFVWPDGSTDVPQVSAEKSLYAAALKLEDGQIAAEPVPEGERYAVIFRAGSLPRVELNEQSRSIARLRLLEASTEADVQALLSSQMEKNVKGRDDVLLGKLRRQGTALFQER